MSQQHDVKFHIGVERVVCTCGQDFCEPNALPGEFDAVSLWAEHVRTEPFREMQRLAEIHRVSDELLFGKSANKTEVTKCAAAPAECKCIFCGGIPLHMQRAETCTCSHLPTDDADGAK